MPEEIGREDMTKSPPLVWIIVLNWNRPEDTERCVASLQESDYAAYRILVVDNGSTDDSVERICAIPGVDVLANGENLGFAAGNNRGIRRALDRDAEYTLILNNDVSVAPDMLSRLVHFAEDNRQIGAIGPLIYYADSPEKVWFAGMTFRDSLYVVRRGLRLREPLRPLEEVDFISGCAMLVRREVWERVGFFDERFFMYYEDLDFALRVKQAGYSIACATEAEMWHTLSASTGGQDSPLKQYYQVKSMVLFTRKHTRGLARLANVSIRLTHAGVVALQQLWRGRCNTETIRWYLRGLSEVFGAGE